METKAINALKFLGLDQINQANSGHPGIVLGAAPTIYTLFTKHLKVSSKHPNWENRDRFVLSAGHGSALLYSILHLTGFNVSMDDLKNFRKKGITPGHPEFRVTQGVDVTSGPLGQGIANAVGLAVAEASLAAQLNVDDLKVVDHYTYALVGDGDLQEGVALEALSFAGRMGLNKLIVLFDSNDIQLDGPVADNTKEDLAKKFEAIGFQYISVSDGESVYAIDRAISKAKRQTDKPTLIEIKTIIGKGSLNENTHKVHGAPLGFEETKRIKQSLGYLNEPFSVDEDVYAHFNEFVTKKNHNVFNQWARTLKKYQEQQPNLYKKYQESLNNFKIDESLFDDVKFKDNDATRSIGGQVLDKISASTSFVIGGSADLSSSTKAKGADGNFDIDNRKGRNINYGVREHAMAAIVNGITYHGGLKAFGSGFFVFSDYMKPSMRLAALSHIPSVFIFTHDSIAVGEDGPTHQPVEQLVGLRSIPNFNTIRPADKNETIAAYIQSFNSTRTPHAIILSRQNLPTLANSSVAGALRGGYIIHEEQGPLSGTIIATGSEVGLAIEVAKMLETDNVFVRVISMPSVTTFEQQTKTYQNQVFSRKGRVIALEMAHPMSWYKYTKYVYGVETFGLSEHQNVVLGEYGFTNEAFYEYAKKVFFK